MRRITVAALIATAITGVLFDPQRAYWTVSAAIAVVELSAVRSYSIGRGKHRTVGTLLGAGLHLLLTRFSGWPMMLVLILMGVQFMIEFVVVRNYALALMFFYAAGAPFYGCGARRRRSHVATVIERVIDTVIGTVIAISTVVMHRAAPDRPEN